MLTKDLKDVYKSAQEVTSLESTDRLTVTDGNGNVKKISQQSFNHNVGSLNVSAPQWVRLFSMNGSGAVTFEISTNYNTGAPSYYIVQLLFDSVSISVMKVVSSVHLDTARMMSKLRLVKEGSLFYVDVYYTNTGANNLRLTVLPCFRTVIPVMTENAAVSADGSAKEFEIQSVGGGKLLYFNKLCHLAERRVA